MCGAQKHFKSGDCSIATGADSKIARQEQGESTWDPLNASELAPNSANGLIPSLIAWAKSQPPGNVAIVSKSALFVVPVSDKIDVRIILAKRSSFCHAPPPKEFVNERGR